MSRVDEQLSATCTADTKAAPYKTSFSFPNAQRGSEQSSFLKLAGLSNPIQFNRILVCPFKDYIVVSQQAVQFFYCVFLFKKIVVCSSVDLRRVCEFEGGHLCNLLSKVLGLRIHCLV